MHNDGLTQLAVLSTVTPLFRSIVELNLLSKSNKKYFSINGSVQPRDGVEITAGDGGTI